MKTWETRPHDWTEEEWLDVSLRWHGRPLVGNHRHFCNDWDDLPIDETCPEFDGCTCWGDRG